MGVLRFRVAGKVDIEFGNGFVDFVRGTVSTKPLSITYTSGTGQTVSTNQVLYTVGTSGTDGYIEIKSLTNQTLSGSGVLNLSITHQVSTTQVDQTISFPLFDDIVNVEIDYNSKPVAEDFTVDILNRVTYTFSGADFTTHYSDNDGDALDAVAIYGVVTGYQVGGTPYIAGDWVLLSTIDAGQLQYVSLDQDAYYEKSNTWKARDINGNVSN